MKDVLNVSGLCFHYAVTKESVLNDISFALKKGEIVAIVGPSGCGKSTLLNIIAGFLKPCQGDISIFTNGAKQEFSYVFQQDALLPWRTVEQNINLARDLGKDGITSSELDLYLENFHLDKRILKKYPSELSGGMRQRVTIIQSLALEPAVFLMDEPFSSLDFYTKLKLEMDFYHMIKKSQKSALVVTHDIDGAIALADRVIVLSGNPATIVDIQTPFEHCDKRPTPEEARAKPEVAGYFDRIWRHLKQENSLI